MGLIYERQLETKIGRQKEEITRLLAENAELKKKSAKKEGQEEAWKFVKNIVLSETYNGYSNNELKEIFGTICLDEIFNLTYTEAAAKVAEWKQKKEEICVGDVLLSIKTHNKCVVTYIGNETIAMLWKDGSSSNRSKKLMREEYKKVRHIDVNAWLAQIGGSSDETEN